jgi:hypothetical protein
MTKDFRTCRIDPITYKRINTINKLLDIYGKMTRRQIYYKLSDNTTLKLNSDLHKRERQIGYVLKLGRIRKLISMEKIVDRSRPSYGFDTWLSKDEIQQHLSKYFKLDYWQYSNNRIEIWSEKDALSQIIYEIAEPYRVPVRVTRGNLSISCKYHWSGDITVLYVGDFDPSGLWIDISLQKYELLKVQNFRRLALLPEHLEGLPSVPLKRKDPHLKWYKKKYGVNVGWELDALPPDQLQSLIKEAIEEYIDFDLDAAREKEQEIRNTFKGRK